MFVPIKSFTSEFIWQSVSANSDWLRATKMWPASSEIKGMKGKEQFVLEIISSVYLIRLTSTQSSHLVDEPDGSL